MQRNLPSALTGYASSRCGGARRSNSADMMTVSSGGCSRDPDWRLPCATFHTTAVLSSSSPLGHPLGHPNLIAWDLTRGGDWTGVRREAHIPPIRSLFTRTNWQTVMGTLGPFNSHALPRLPPLRNSINFIHKTRTRPAKSCRMERTPGHTEEVDHGRAPNIRDWHTVHLPHTSFGDWSRYISNGSGSPTSGYLTMGRTTDAILQVQRHAYKRQLCGTLEGHPAFLAISVMIIPGSPFVPQTQPHQ